MLEKSLATLFALLILATLINRFLGDAANLLI